MRMADRDVSALAEWLEGRVLLAGVSYDGETLLIEGDERRQIVEVDAGSWNTTVRFDANGNGSFTDPGDIVMPYGQVKRLDIRTAGGDDKVTVNLGRDSGRTIITDLFVYLGEGNDELAIRGGDGGGGSVRLPDHLSIRVLGAGGDDVVGAGFRATSASISFDVDTGAGNDQASFGFSPYLYGSAGGTVRLGEGNDYFGAGVGGREHRFRGNVTFTAYGGDGQDTLGGSVYEDPEIQHNSGSLSLNLYGEGGDDYVSRPKTVRGISAYVKTDNDDPPPPPGPQLVSLSGRVVDNTATEVGEEEFPGVTVYLDLNNNGELDTGEPSGKSDDWYGSYYLYTEPQNSYTIRAIAPEGWHFVGDSSITIPSGGRTYDRDFALATTGIRGWIEPGSLSGGGSVYLDLNRNGNLDANEPRAIPKPNGSYELLGIRSGRYQVRCVPPEGYQILVGTKAAYDIELANDQVAGGVSFQIASAGVTGYVSSRSASIEGVVVYVDANKDGRLNDGEISTRSDSSGRYSFTELAPGTYSIRVVPPEGWFVLITGDQPTVVQAGKASFGGNFQLFPPGLRGTVQVLGGAAISTQVYLDINGNQSFDQGEPSTQTDVAGQFYFASLPYGEYWARAIIPDGLQARTGSERGVWIHAAPGQWQDAIYIQLQENVTDPPVLSISGSVFHDANRNGLKDNGWMGLAPETGLLGITVWLDGARSTTTDYFGNFTFKNVTKGQHRVWMSSEDWNTFAPKGGTALVTVDDWGGSAQLAVVPAGDTPPVADSTIRGTVYDDRNGSGLRDDDENGTPGVTVFLDANNNLRRDRGESIAITDSAGDYSFTGLQPGAYYVVVVRPEGSLTLSPSRYVNVGTGMVADGIDFALLPYAGLEGYPTGANAGQAITGTENDDVIRVSAAMVMVNGQQVQGVQVTINGETGQAFVPDVYIAVYAGDGNDRVTIDADVSFIAMVCAGNGNDTIESGGGDDFLDGGAGDDVIWGRGGSDAIYGWAGDDSMYGGDGEDLLFGGEGDDRCSGEEGKDTVRGGAGLDTLSGGLGADTITGGRGDDQINGGAGPDSLVGSDGADLLHGGEGRDRMEGWGKADTLLGGAGDDTIIGGAGENVLFGDDGDDEIHGSAHWLFHDYLRGGEGWDRYEADGNDVLTEVEEVWG